MPRQMLSDGNGLDPGCVRSFSFSAVSRCLTMWLEPLGIPVALSSSSWRSCQSTSSFFVRDLHVGHNKAGARLGAMGGIEQQILYESANGAHFKTRFINNNKTALLQTSAGAREQSVVPPHNGTATPGHHPRHRVSATPTDILPSNGQLAVIPQSD